MGLQQSKEALLFQQVTLGNIEAIKGLHREGASLEWFSKDGKTPLIAACMDANLYEVAKTLIELGANVNAYRSGHHAGTALHHAAQMGLERTVKLLLSHGANALVMNDNFQTPLKVARIVGYNDVVRTIESHFCFFSGWIRELYGPGFLEALVPQLLSRKIWAVVVPCGSRNPRKLLKLELAIYTTRQDAKPRGTIKLWKAKVEEPNFKQPVPALNIFDKDTRTRHKFISSDEHEKKQLQRLCNACRGIPQVMQQTLLPYAHTPTDPLTTPPPSAEDVDLARAISASLQSAMEERPPIRDSHLSFNESNVNGWGSSTDNSNNNGWLSTAPAPLEASSGEPRVDSYNGWGTSETGGSSNPAHENISAPGPALNNSSLVSANNTTYNGWGSTGGSGPPSNLRFGGWWLKPGEILKYWLGKVETGSTSNLAQNHSIPIVSTNPVVLETTSAPSAPPVSENADYGPIHYPSIDSSPVDLSSVDPIVPSTETKETATGQGKDDVGSCVICLDAPVEGACIPCGHMAGCMSCLNEIKAKKWGCPVCRSKIEQILRLYAV